MRFIYTLSLNFKEHTAQVPENLVKKKEKQFCSKYKQDIYL